MSDSDLLIRGPESPEPSQLREHATVAARANVALWIAAIAVLIAGVAAFFAFLQWRAADRQANIASGALELAKQAAADQKQAGADQKADIERSRKAAENSASAAADLARSNASMADTMRTQSTLSSRQNEDLENQASARLVFKNLKVEDTPDATLISFDVVNAGNSEATQIGEGSRNGPGIMAPDSPARAELLIGGTNPAGPTLEKGESIQREVRIQKPSSPRQPSYLGAWSAFYRFTYVDIFQRVRSDCAIITPAKYYRFVFTPCPSAVLKKQ